jgi:uncharacterized Zn finger protein (UPF0148 family)
VLSLIDAVVDRIREDEVEGVLRRLLVRAGAKRLGFTCPRCRLTSYHPTDLAEGYCGACHAFTGHDEPRA